MRLLFFICFIFFYVSLLNVYASSRHALVVGNSEYRIQKLKNPVNDCRAMSMVLNNCGFNVIRVENANKINFENAISKFIFNIKKNDIALLYYAGHGVQVDGENYLIQIDSDIKNEHDLKYKAINVSYILDEINASGAEVKIIILDACRDNPFRSNSRSIRHGLARMDAGLDTIIAYSTSPGSVAMDGENGNGVYTKHLVSCINEPNINIIDMFMNVRRGVMRDTNSDQIPWESSSLTSHFYFFDGKADNNVNRKKLDDTVAHISPDFMRDGELVDPVTKMQFVWVPAGCFEMGCGAWGGSCNRDETPVHKVCLSGYWIGKFEVTQEQWIMVMQNNPSFFKNGGSYPVDSVTIADVNIFIATLNKMNNGKFKFRLPTEAEWEYAARDCGQEQKYSGGGSVASVAWYSLNSGRRTHAVGTKFSNSIGIYDMSGNVSEIVADKYASNAYKMHDMSNPMISLPDDKYVIRGGGWNSSANDIRTTFRNSFSTLRRSKDVGFRLVCEN